MPACGGSPDAIANAIASGSATRPTVTPAIEIGDERRTAVVAEEQNRLGRPVSHP